MPPVNLSGLDALNQVQRLRVGAPLPNSDPTLDTGTLDADRLILRNTAVTTEANATNATIVVATLSADVTITFPATTGTVLLQGGPASTDLDMGGFLITNIGAGGTDFTAGGGLTLAAGLTVSAGGISAAGQTVTATTFTGNAATATLAAAATILATSRNINGTAFNGSGDITITAAAGTLTGNTLAAGVTASSLTSVGVLAAPHMTSAVVDSGGLTVTAGNLGVNTAVVAGQGINIGNTLTAANPIAINSRPALVGSSSGDIRNVFALSAITVNSAVVTARAAQVWAEGVTATDTGTLNNHNAGYFGTPVSGTTVRVIDSASGAFLTTAGVWTDNPCYEFSVDGSPLKRDVTTIPWQEVDTWLNYFAKSYTPKRFFYADRYEDCEVPIYEERNGKQVQCGTKTETRLACYEGPRSLPHVAYTLEEQPEWFVDLVCDEKDETGRASGRRGGDESGMLMAMVARQQHQITRLLAKAGLN
jgi:hypothetical protein